MSVPRARPPAQQSSTRCLSRRLRDIYVALFTGWHRCRKERKQRDHVVGSNTYPGPQGYDSECRWRASLAPERRPSFPPRMRRALGPDGKEGSQLPDGPPAIVALPLCWSPPACRCVCGISQRAWRIFVNKYMLLTKWQPRAETTKGCVPIYASHIIIPNCQLLIL